jgi:hypothetical protein
MGEGKSATHESKHATEMHSTIQVETIEPGAARLLTSTS